MNCEDGSNSRNHRECCRAILGGSVCYGLVMVGGVMNNRSDQPHMRNIGISLMFLGASPFFLKFLYDIACLLGQLGRSCRNRCGFHNHTVGENDNNDNNMIEPQPTIPAMSTLS